MTLEAPAVAGVGPPAVRVVVEPTVVRWEVLRMTVMGSTAEVVIGDAPPRLAAWAAAELRRLEACWTRFDAGSPLARLNRSAGAGRIEIDPVLGLAIGRALTLWRATGGLFDPTVHDALLRAGYDRTFAEVRRTSDEPPEAATPVPDAAGVELGADLTWARLPHDVHLDLGGVGKGLAADLVAEGLVERGARAVCVALGGDVRVAGRSPEPAGWAIPVEAPRREPELLGTVRLLAPAAVVTSTRLIRRWWRAGLEQHHLIDPRRGAPAWSGLAAVVVEASEAWWSEGLAKAALIAGAEKGRELLSRHGANGWLVADDGTALRIGPPIGDGGW